MRWDYEARRCFRWDGSLDARFVAQVNYNDMVVDGAQPAEGPKALVVFIHGFLARDTTWRKLLRHCRLDADLRAAADFETFEYSTAANPGCLVTLASLATGGKNRVVKHASSIVDVARNLRQRLSSGVWKPYDRIYLVGHSTGGLVARQCFLGMGIERHRIKGIGLLAVPNTGAQLANLGATFIPANAQLTALSINSAFIDNLNTLWENAELTGLHVRYFIGDRDRIVTRGAAGYGARDDQIYDVLDADHNTIFDFICEPESFPFFKELILAPPAQEGTDVAPADDLHSPSRPVVQSTSSSTSGSNGQAVGLVTTTLIGLSYLALLLTGFVIISMASNLDGFGRPWPSWIWVMWVFIWMAWLGVDILNPSRSFGDWVHRHTRGLALLTIPLLILTTSGESMLLYRDWRDRVNEATRVAERQAKRDHYHDLVLNTIEVRDYPTAEPKLVEALRLYPQRFEAQFLVQWFLEKSKDGSTPRAQANEEYIRNAKSLFEQLHQDFENPLFINQGYEDLKGSYASNQALSEPCSWFSFFEYYRPLSSGSESATLDERIDPVISFVERSSDRTSDPAAKESLELIAEYYKLYGIVFNPTMEEISADELPTILSAFRRATRMVERAEAIGSLFKQTHWYQEMLGMQAASAQLAAWGSERFPTAAASQHFESKENYCDHAIEALDKSLRVRRSWQNPTQPWLRPPSRLGIYVYLRYRRGIAQDQHEGSIVHMFEGMSEAFRERLNVELSGAPRSLAMLYPDLVDLSRPVPEFEAAWQRGDVNDKQTFGDAMKVKSFLKVSLTDGWKEEMDDE
jgi:pimeloyl-ACP methyl ester carboxylesterase